MKRTHQFDQSTPSDTRITGRSLSCTSVFKPGYRHIGRPGSKFGAILLASVTGLIFNHTALATSWETSSLRTAGGGLVRIGMPRQEVLKELGQTERPRRITAVSKKSGKQGSSINYRGSDGLYTITFSGERVVRIVVTPNRN